MNNILLRTSNDNEKNNYKMILILTLFLIFKIFYTGIYPCIYGNGSLYFIFKPIIFYLVYYFILFFVNKKSVSYDMISSLIISFIIPNNINLLIFIIGSIIGNIICHIFKNKINNITISFLLITIITNNITLFNYTGIFAYIYLALCLFSSFYLILNKLIKTRLLISIVISMIIIFYINNNIILDNLPFIILFIILDNRHSPITKSSQIAQGIIFGILLHTLNYLFAIRYAYIILIFIFEILTIIINYLSIKLYNNKVLKYLFSI